MNLRFRLFAWVVAVFAILKASNAQINESLSDLDLTNTSDSTEKSNSPIQTSSSSFKLISSIKVSPTMISDQKTTSQNRGKSQTSIAHTSLITELEDTTNRKTTTKSFGFKNSNRSSTSASFVSDSLNPVTENSLINMQRGDSTSAKITETTDIDTTVAFSTTKSTTVIKPISTSTQTASESHTLISESTEANLATNTVFDQTTDFSSQRNSTPIDTTSDAFVVSKSENEKTTDSDDLNQMTSKNVITTTATPDKLSTTSASKKTTSKLITPTNSNSVVSLTPSSTSQDHDLKETTFSSSSLKSINIETVQTTSKELKSSSTPVYTTKSSENSSPSSSTLTRSNVSPSLTPIYNHSIEKFSKEQNFTRSISDRINTLTQTFSTPNSTHKTSARTTIEDVDKIVTTTIKPLQNNNSFIRSNSTIEESSIATQSSYSLHTTIINIKTNQTGIWNKTQSHQTSTNSKTEKASDQQDKSGGENEKIKTSNFLDKIFVEKNFYLIVIVGIVLTLMISCMVGILVSLIRRKYRSQSRFRVNEHTWRPRTYNNTGGYLPMQASHNGLPYMVKMTSLNNDHYAFSTFRR